MKEYTVYILRSQKDGKRYIGLTNDFVRRFSEHQYGKVKSTSQRRPLDIIHALQALIRGVNIAYKKIYGIF